MNTLIPNRSPHNVLQAFYTDFSEVLRPRDFSELTIPDSQIERLKKAALSRDIPNLILYGSFGTGKTSCANLLSQDENLHSLVLNCALDITKRDVRSLVEPFATAASLFGKSKIIVLDEAEFIPTSAQTALRGLIEKTIHHVRYIFTCNSIEKIDKAIRSRCVSICFDSLSTERESCLKKITRTAMSRLHELKMTVDESAVFEIVRQTYPDLRQIAKRIEFELL
jgi:replication-associated recombination protein RarA